MIFPVYVPADDDRHLQDVIEPGSGIIGQPYHAAQQLTLYYEGNLNGSNRTFANKVTEACTRYFLQHSTVGRVCVVPTSVVQVGTYDESTRTVQVADKDRLAKWLGLGGADKNWFAKLLRLKRASEIPAHQLVYRPTPAAVKPRTEPVKARTAPRAILQSKYSVSPRYAPLVSSAEMRTTIAKKLSPNRLQNMSGTMATIVGYVLEDRYTSAAGWQTDNTIAEFQIKDGSVVKRHDGDSSFEFVCTESDLVARWKELLDEAGVTRVERTLAQEQFYEHLVFRKPPFSEAKPKEPYKFYRKLTSSEESMIAQHLAEHPGLTRNEVLEELEGAGF